MSHQSVCERLFFYKMVCIYCREQPIGLLKTCMVRSIQESMSRFDEDCGFLAAFIVLVLVF